MTSLLNAASVARAQPALYIVEDVHTSYWPGFGGGLREPASFIEFAKDLRAQGKPLVAATIEACSLRFRPILMTGLAFVCGVLPMVVASGAGGASQQALGTSVMGGMIAVVILASFLYVYAKTKHLLKSLSAAFLLYLIAFLYFCVPHRSKLDHSY